MIYEKCLVSVLYLVVCIAKTLAKYLQNAKYETCIAGLVIFSQFEKFSVIRVLKYYILKEIKNTFARLFEKVLQKVKKKFEKILITSFENFQKILHMFKN